MAVPWFESKISAASEGSFADDEDVAFGLGIGLDRDQVRASRRDLSRLHFDFSERKTNLEFSALIT
jgi:hypothetical protein